MTTPYRVVVTGLARAQFLALASSSLYEARHKPETLVIIRFVTSFRGQVE